MASIRGPIRVAPAVPTNAIAPSEAMLVQEVSVRIVPMTHRVKVAMPRSGKSDWNRVVTAPNVRLTMIPVRTSAVGSIAPRRRLNQYTRPSVPTAPQSGATMGVPEALTCPETRKPTQATPAIASPAPELTPTR